MTDRLADAASEAYVAGLAAVDPTVLVRKAVRQGLLDDWFESREKPKPIHVLAFGKAAPRMLWGLVEGNVPFAGFGVAPRGVPAPNVDTFTWLPGDHPVPGEQSFAAGEALLDWVKGCPKDSPILVLLSGGASACVEVPRPGVSRDDLRARWLRLLRAGEPIEAMNAQRTQWSALKGGQLGRLLLERTSRIRVWTLADTAPATAAAAVGSGPFFQADAPERIPHRTLGHNGDLVAAAGLRLATLGFQVYRHGARIAGDAAGEVAGFLDAAHGLRGDGPVALVGGGEPTVALSADAPKGGRCQHSALLAAKWLADHKSAATFLAAASDGVDGSSDASGAFASAADWTKDAGSALAGFDAHRFLDRRGRLLHMGPTGTNVNDLWVCLRN